MTLLRHRFLSVVAAAAIAALTLLACETAPYTGRKQFILLSPEEENTMGLQAYQEVVAQSRMSSKAAWAGMVERVGRRIAAVAERPDFQWEFRLIEDPTVNAFCLPGGKVAFYEGIMPVCADDTGVAVVMGHEVAHAMARHGGERVSQSMVAQLGTEVAAEVIGSKDPAVREMVAVGLGAGVNVGVMLPFSRKHESEADQIGLILMAKAGYDPRAAPKFWERMNAMAGGSRPPEFLSTHPNPETRIAQLQSWMPEALPYYEAATRRP